MRRALREQLPAFALLYGIKPWEIERLMFGEIEVFQRHAERMARERR